MTGGLHSEDDRCEAYAAGVECAVFAVDYRLAPEHPFPAALDDCWHALTWMAERAAELSLDPRRLSVGGLSAGGALAAGLAQRVRDCGGPPLNGAGRSVTSVSTAFTPVVIVFVLVLTIATEPPSHILA